MSTPLCKTNTKNPIAAAAQSGAELLVKNLEAQGVEYIFGIPGAKIDKVFDMLVDSKIKTVVCRHEQNAALIAGGIGRITGKAVYASGPPDPDVPISSRASRRRPPKAIRSLHWAVPRR